MWIGYSKHKKNNKILEFHSIKDPIKILGAHLSYNADKNNDANFFSKIRKMKAKLNLWQTRDLTLFGKSVLAKTLHCFTNDCPRCSNTRGSKPPVLVFVEK